MDPQLLDIGLRLGAATAVGVIIGVNRDLKEKPAGMRTLGLVALGAAVIALAAIQYDGMVGHPDALSRVIQGVLQGIMTGVGFIGAGAILRDAQAQRIEGVTTAASVWVTAALAVACAFAAWRIVVIGLALTLILLVVFAWFEKRN